MRTLSEQVRVKERKRESVSRHGKCIITKTQSRFRQGAAEKKANVVVAVGHFLTATFELYSINVQFQNWILQLFT